MPGLAIAALLIFGLLQGAILIAFPLILGRLAPAGPGLLAATRFKLARRLGRHSC